MVQGPVSAVPPSFSTIPQISTTAAANFQCGQEIPTPLLEGLYPPCSYHDQACHPILPQGDSNPLCSASVQLETLLISPCWSLPLAEGSSCCARPAGHLWSLILLILKGCGCQSISLKTLFPAPFSCFLESVLPLPKEQFLEACPAFPCWESSVSQGTQAPVPPAEPFFAAHPVFLTTEGKQFLRAEITPK